MVGGWVVGEGWLGCAWWWLDGGWMGCGWVMAGWLGGIAGLRPPVFIWGPSFWAAPFVMVNRRDRQLQTAVLDVTFLGAAGALV